MLKKILPLILCLFTLLSIAHAQVAFDNTLAMATPSSSQPRYQLKVFPNPATNFISLSQNKGVSQIAVFNVVGRHMKTFRVITADEKHDISRLPTGMYLIQLLDENKKVITTQRLHKR